MYSDITRRELSFIIEQINIDSAENPIIVEGKKDIESLRKIGVTGLIYSLNGRSASELVDELREYKKIIILTDYDSEGIRIRDKLVENFQLSGIKADLRYHRFIKKIIKGLVLQIEGLFNFLRNKGLI